MPRQDNKPKVNNNAKDAVGRLVLTLAKGLELEGNISSRGLTQEHPNRALGKPVVIDSRVIAYGADIHFQHGGLQLMIEFADSNRDMENDAVISVTSYVGFYFHPNARVQINPVLRFPEAGDTVVEFVTQAQVEF